MSKKNTKKNVRNHTMIKYYIDWGSIACSRTEKWCWNKIRILKSAHRIILNSQLLYWFDNYEYVQEFRRENYFKIIKTLFSQPF